MFFNHTVQLSLALLIAQYSISYRDYLIFKYLIFNFMVFMHIQTYIYTYFPSLVPSNESYGVERPTTNSSS